MTPTQKKKARDSVSQWCADAVKNNLNWEYSQARPFRFVDRPGVGRHTGDCSGLVISCFWNVQHDLKMFVEDPSGQRFTGYGNTWSMESWLRAHGKPVIEVNGYLVGDIAMYRGHTTLCTKAGSGQESDWTSHGGDRDPRVVKLHYREDFIGCWRHPALL